MIGGPSPVEPSICALILRSSETTVSLRDRSFVSASGSTPSPDHASRCARSPLNRIAPLLVLLMTAACMLSGCAGNGGGNIPPPGPPPPTITAQISPQPNAKGWNNTDVTVSFTCTDAGSGIATCPSPQIVTAEGAKQVISGTATNKAGTSATAKVTLNIDKTPPTISITSPNNGSSSFSASQTISGVVTDTLSGIASVTCNGTPASLNVGTFSCEINLSAGTNPIVATATDVAGNTSTSNLTLAYIPAPVITITSPSNLSFLNISPTTINGTINDPNATIMVNGLSAPQSAGIFSVALPLAEGPNIVTATATASTGATSTASIQITLDTAPPHVTITEPPDKFVTTDASISIAGNVNDTVVGTVNDQQAQVTVNGIAAQVANRTFLATSVPLNVGDNTIQAVARDRSGNAATTQITVTRQVSSQAQIKLISGNNQTGVIGSALSSPLVIALTDSSGNPPANKPVIFKVTQNNGMVSTSGAPTATLVATTNAQGQAQAQWTLGMRAGAGGNSVEAYSVGFAGTAIFSASGTQGTPGLIVIDSGNDQIGAINQPLPRPLIAVVVDGGNNRLPGVPVTFTVMGGGGSFNGQSSFTTTTDSDGRAAATLTLGLQEGNANNLVAVNFPSNQGLPASFTASGRAPGDPANTTISGVVLDNSNVPIPGVTIRAVLTNLLTSNSSSIQSVAAVQADAQGQFTIPKAPVGFVKLLVDGSTASVPGKYPTLDYDMVTVSGQNNTVGMPIYLLPLNAINQLCVTATTGGGTLTMPEAPGFSLTFAPGQVTFPGGSKSGCVGVTVVHGDKIPMVPGFGQQPRFIVTIQPSGALFNPPAPITLPNVDGLQPREVTEMYSFDHDIGSFVAIGTGTVSDDGQIIRSNQGVGVLKAGWHCGGNPTAIGTAANCPICLYCVGVTAPGSTVPGICVPDPGQMGTSCAPSGNPCLAGVCAGAPQGNGNPLRPTGQCNLSFVNGSCVVGGQAGTCGGGVCQGPPNQGQCPGGTIVNGVCVSPPCTPGAPGQPPPACTTGSNSPGTCNQNGQCIGSGGGGCNSPTSVDLNGICVVPNCSAPGTGGLLCNAGGNLPGTCLNNQCQGSGNQCSTSCNGAVCVNGQCSNSCAGAPDNTPCGTGGTCQGGVCTQCQLQIEASSAAQNPNGAIATAAISSPGLFFCQTVLQVHVGIPFPMSVGTCTAGTCPLPSGLTWSPDPAAAPLVSVVQAGSTASLTVSAGSPLGQIGSIILSKFENGILTEIDRKAIEVVGGGISVRLSNKTYKSIGKQPVPLTLLESGFVNKRAEPPLDALFTVPISVDIIPCPPNLDCAGQQERVSANWVESQPNPHICPNPDGRCTMSCTAQFPSSGQSAFCDMEFDLDSSPPSISYSLNPSPSHFDPQGAPWLNLQDLGRLPGLVTASFSCSDPDDTPGTTDNVRKCPDPLMIRLVSDGKGQTFTSGPATDLPGNINTKNVVLNLDSTAPNIPLPPLVSPSPNINGWNNGTVNLTFTATDILSGINASLSSVEINGARSPGLSATLSADGTYNVRALAVDYAGNIQISDFQIFKIDSIPPVIVNIIPADGSTVTTQTVQIVGTLTDNLSGVDPNSVSCTLATNTVSGLVSGGTFKCQPLSLQPGPNQILIGAKDEAGNPRVVQITLNH
jgi:hypothetical protein